MEEKQNLRNLNEVHDPTWTMFVGPMFGSKTTRLVAAIDRYRYQNKSIVVFKPKMDTRYEAAKITTHAGASLDAVCVGDGSEIVKYVNNMSTCDVVAVDEAFMIDDCADALLHLFRRGISIVVSSLQLSASGNAFFEVKEMMPWATKIEVCPAVCPLSGRDAFYTHRKLDGLEEITVGGSDLYEPRSWQHHNFMNQRK